MKDLFIGRCSLWTHAEPLMLILQLPRLIHDTDKHVSQGHPLLPFSFPLGAAPVPIRQLRTPSGRYGEVSCWQLESDDVCKYWCRDQLYADDQSAVRFAVLIQGTARTYPLQNGVHKASIAVVDESRRQQSALLLLLALFPGLVHFYGSGCFLALQRHC